MNIKFKLKINILFYQKYFYPLYNIFKLKNNNLFDCFSFN